ncbi:MAG: hypothetical protein IPJ74_11580 [Saprospiraceae bacterium]|nr:hypothetical protein [Saprospiraceae bacterium]
MERFKIILLAIALLGLSFTLVAQPVHKVSNGYKIIEDNGVFVEQFPTFNTSDNRYTEDNVTYTAGVSFTYNYRFLDREGKEYLHRNVEGTDLDANKAWELVPFAENDGSAVQSVKMTVLYGLQGLDEMKPGYNRTVVQYDYLTAQGNANYSEVTGLVENAKNIWMNPPRSKQFRILELNPAPFIQAPYAVGNKWNWTKMVGSFWSDERWAEWDGLLINTYQYEITDFKTVNTQFGELECYEVTARAQNEIGNTEMIALFNPDFGFVQMNFTNIDGSKITMDLEERAVEGFTASKN